MAINPDIFIHPADRAALNKLKAIPGFTPLLKAFMKIWSEKNLKIEYLSTKLQVNEKQMPEYYNMLNSICEQIGINTPELYIEIDPIPNAYTVGENNPMIVMTSGLIETLPNELIPTVLAHECGHILCHHVLYTTMGHLILSSGLTGGSLAGGPIAGLSALISAPLEWGFYYWMRTSEYSADRVAVVYDKSSEKMTDVCMYFAGYDKDFPFKPNKTAFMHQAEEYENLVNDSGINKTYEYLLVRRNTHPLCAVRANACYKWASTDAFHHLCAYIEEESKGITDHQYIPTLHSSEYYIGKKRDAAVEELMKEGFTNVDSIKVIGKEFLTKEQDTVRITIGDTDSFSIGDWFKRDEKCIVTYYEAETDEEAAAAHPGQIKTTNSSSYYIGKPYEIVVSELKQLGFTTINLSSKKVNKVLWLNKENCVSSISIGGVDKFAKNMWFDKNADVDIVYNVNSSEKGE